MSITLFREAWENPNDGIFGLTMPFLEVSVLPLKGEDGTLFAFFFRKNVQKGGGLLWRKPVVGVFPGFP